MAAVVIPLGPRIWAREVERLAALRAAWPSDPPDQPPDDDWAGEWDSRDSSAYQDEQEAR
jgi:hypothetical protein